TSSAVPGGISAPATSDGGTAVSYSSPSASDLVDGPVPVSCAPASGSNFPVGTTTVVCSARDRAGNTASASFTVTVTLGRKLTVTTSGGGSVTSDPAGIDCGSSCFAVWLPGTLVTLRAAPAPGFRFAGWNGGCTGTGACQFTLWASAKAVASFVPL